MLLPSHHPVKPSARYRERTEKQVTNPSHRSVQKQTNGMESYSNAVFSKSGAIQVRHLST